MEQLTEKEVFIKRLEEVKPIIKNYFLKRDINTPIDIVEFFFRQIQMLLDS